MKKIVILDYASSLVRVMRLPEYLYNKQTEEIEEWLVDNGYNLSQTEWMCGNIDIALDI